MAYSLLVSSVTSQIINSWPNKKLLNYSFLEQIKDILPSIGLAVIMGACVLLLDLIPIAYWLVFIIQVFAGAVIYIASSAFFKIDSFEYLLSIVKNKMKNKKEEGK